MPEPKKIPWLKHQAPTVCTDCQDPANPPVQTKSTPRQLEHVCPKCKLLHITGLPVSAAKGG